MADLAVDGMTVQMDVVQAKSAQMDGAGMTSVSREQAETFFRCFGVLSGGPARQVQGASEGEVAILGTLARSGGQLSPGDLAELLRLSTSRVANALKNMERKGLVTRQINPNDRRGILVSITPKGREFGEKSFQGAIDQVQSMLSALDPDDVNDLVRVLEKVARTVAKNDGVDYDKLP